MKKILAIACLSVFIVGCSAADRDTLNDMPTEFAHDVKGLFETVKGLF